MVSVWSSAGNLSRSISELGNTSVEQQRMLRNNNTVTTKFMGEKDARAQEASEQTDKAMDLEFKKIAASKSREAAKWGAIGAALNLLGTALKIAAASAGIKDDKFSWANTFSDAVNGVGTVVTKLLDMLKARAEEEAAEEDLKRLNGQRCQTDESVAALDSNPYG